MRADLDGNHDLRFRLRKARVVDARSRGGARGGANFGLRDHTSLLRAVSVFEGEINAYPRIPATPRKDFHYPLQNILLARSRSARRRGRSELLANGFENLMGGLIALDPWIEPLAGRPGTTTA